MAMLEGAERLAGGLVHLQIFSSFVLRCSRGLERLLGIVDLLLDELKILIAGLKPRLRILDALLQLGQLGLGSPDVNLFLLGGLLDDIQGLLSGVVDRCLCFVLGLVPFGFRATNLTPGSTAPKMPPNVGKKQPN